MNLQEAKDKLGIDDGAYQAGKLIHELRAIHNLTQKQMAEKVGVKQEAIARAESLEYYPTVRFLEKVCKAFNTKLVIGWRL